MNAVNNTLRHYGIAHMVIPEQIFSFRDSVDIFTHRSRQLLTQTRDLQLFYTPTTATSWIYHHQSLYHPLMKVEEHSPSTAALTNQPPSKVEAPSPQL